MPLSKIQSDILRLLAVYRDPESYVAGSTPLNRAAVRFSRDIDVFHDRQERVIQAAMNDAGALEAAGYSIRWLLQQPVMYAAAVTMQGAGTRLDWVVDSDYRFFPTVRDELFGYVLHPVDLAMNKTMAAAGRRELRDLVDLVTVHESILPLGAIVWAAVEKAPGFTPEGLIAEIRRNQFFPADDWRGLVSSEPIDPKVVGARLRAILDEADAFVAKMPTSKAGLLFLKDGHVVQPDPARLEDYQTHAGRRRGQWPTNSEISSAMFDRYMKSPEPPENTQ
ncbi:MAG: hypothetical protein ABJC09_16005 [Terriglobia bacterium]